uniref:ATP synthase subunit a n=1 Tax=Phrynus sp. 1 SEM-2008 TaxID=507471 RepID=B2CKD7_9ARAC|nr:ATP synthase subunit 6 [Phrynus sp. 1 SEM-2008]
MMTNLFTIFDPSSPPIFSLNWLALSMPILVLPSLFFLTPSKYQSVFKNIPLFLQKEMKLLLSTSFQKGSTLILISIFLFIIWNNFMGLLPYIFTATSHLLISLSLALPIWLTLMLFGWLWNSFKMFSHLVPLGTPMALASFMVCVETISNLIRPITLSVRLSANMIAGHLILTLLSNCFSLNLLSSFILLPETALILLETAVAIIQAYVFTILITLYSTEIH